MDKQLSSESARIGKTLTIKGEISGTGDILIDGSVEGSVQLDGSTVTIGPNGVIRAGVKAKNVIVQGRVNGNIFADDRTDLRGTATANGDIKTRRIAIEEGATFKGKLEVESNTKGSG